ncbi:hypothetical protein PG999_005414 [Apiospora kogelbergensis]|uniref:Uncharacterized protein n=1 Tax=Apiospora kogelbergensis TaxID=1337665 RepID=A0AAW0R242_9PEZI
MYDPEHENIEKQTRQSSTDTKELNVIPNYLRPDVTSKEAAHSQPLTAYVRQEPLRFHGVLRIRRIRHPYMSYEAGKYLLRVTDEAVVPDGMVPFKPEEDLERLDQLSPGILKMAVAMLGFQPTDIDCGSWISSTCMSWANETFVTVVLRVMIKQPPVLAGARLPWRDDVDELLERLVAFWRKYQLGEPPSAIPLSSLPHPSSTIDSRPRRMGRRYPRRRRVLEAYQYTDEPRVLNSCFPCVSAWEDICEPIDEKQELGCSFINSSNSFNYGTEKPIKTECRGKDDDCVMVRVHVSLDDQRTNPALVPPSGTPHTEYLLTTYDPRLCTIKRRNQQCGIYFERPPSTVTTSFPCLYGGRPGLLYPEAHALFCVHVR